MAHHAPLVKENPGDEFASEVRTELTIAAKTIPPIRESIGWGLRFSRCVKYPA